MITVNFFTTLRIFLNRAQLKVYADDLNIGELLRTCQAQLPKPFLQKLLTHDATLIPGTIILLNGQNILHLQGVETCVKHGDEVALFPPGGGG